MAKEGKKDKKKGKGKLASPAASPLPKQASSVLDRLLEKSASSGPVSRIKESQSVSLRFLFDLDDGRGWEVLNYYFDREDQRSVFLTEGERPPGGQQVRTGFYAVAHAEDTGETTVWELRKSVFQQLRDCYLEFGTITDRPYKISRKGSGKNSTEYSAIPLGEAPLSKALKRERKENETKLAEVIELLVHGRDDDED